METGEFIVRWSARIAMLLYALALALWLSRPARHRTLARWPWTFGCIIYIFHVLAAFHFYHGWQHANAFAHTARRTWETTGWDWGGGIYFNYLFTAVWLFDVVWLWANPRSYAARPRWLSISLHAFLAFMAINATIVFGPPAARIIGVVALVTLVALAGLGLEKRHPPCA